MKSTIARIKVVVFTCLAVMNLAFPLLAEAQQGYVREERFYKKLDNACVPMKKLSSRQRELLMFQNAQTVQKGDSRDSLIEKFGNPDTEKESFSQGGKLDGIQMLFNIHRRNMDVFDDHCDTYIQASFDGKMKLVSFSFKRGAPVYHLAD